MKKTSSIKRLVIIAGEESGDRHAARIVTELVKKHPQWQFSGIGGRHMQDAGIELISDLACYGVTGLTEVIRHLRIIKKAFRDIKAHLQEKLPDLLILVDYPGFNLRLAKFAKQVLGIRILYYISPQIWAWKAKRIHTIRENIDHMAVILPFEKKLYEDANVPVTFVGHPLIESIPTNLNMRLCRAQLKLPQHKQLIALLPGSRKNEIERHMPILAKTAEILLSRLENVHFVIPIAGTIRLDHIRQYLRPNDNHFSFVEGHAVETMASSDFVIVASGTASFECALLGKPMCIIYKASWLTYLAASMLIKVQYLGLCNLLANQMIVPEFLQYDCHPTELSNTVMQLIKNKPKIDSMSNQLAKMRDRLSEQSADENILDLIEREV